MARYSSRRRLRRTRPRRRRSYGSTARYYGGKLLRGAGYAVGAGAATMAAVGIYRNYPELVEYFKSLGYKGAELLNKVYEYLASSAVPAVESGRDVAGQMYARANNRWDAYKIRSKPFEWSDYLHQFERVPGDIAGQSTRHELGPDVPAGFYPQPDPRRRPRRIPRSYFLQ